MISHGQVRQWVMGHERCNLSDKPGGPVSHPLTLEEKHAMAECVKEGIAAGAIGFSTNRFSGHRDTSGVMVPGTLGDADEMIMIGKAVAEAGGGVYEMAADFSCYDDIPAEKRTRERVQEHYNREWGWLKFLAQEYGLTVNFGGGGPERRRQMDEANAEIQANGGSGRITCQVFARPQAVIMVSPHRTISSRSHHHGHRHLHHRVRLSAGLGIAHAPVQAGAAFPGPPEAPPHRDALPPRRPLRPR